MSTLLDSFRKTEVSTDDGLKIAAFDSGPPTEDDAGMTLFLVNGLGGNLAAWTHLVRHFRPRHRIVTWDYRGLYASRFDGDTNARHQRGEVALDMDAHRRDGLRVLDALGIERAVFLGWSMGVQLNWELYRQHRGRVAAMVQICGAAANVLDTTALGAIGKAVAMPSMDLWRRVATKFGPVVAKALASPRALAAAAAFGAVAPSIDTNVASGIIAEYVALDFDVYNKILAALAGADATGMLAAIDVPVLLVAGDRDVFTPAPLAESMAKVIPGSELLVIRGGSHYLPIEFPALLNETIASFLARRIR